MKKRANFLLVIPIIFMLLSGCASIQKYISGEQPTEEGVSYVPIEEIPLEEVPNETPQEVPAIPIEPEEPTTEETPVVEETKPTTPAKGLPRIVVNETDLVSLQFPDKDADGDPVTYTYSQPLNDKGEWQTKIGDAGEHTVVITASDGKLTTTQQLIIEVKSKNRPPVMETIQDVTVNEGDMVSFSLKVVDPEGDKVTITYSGWMTTSSYRTRFTDTGTHTLTITASDGINTVSQDVKVIVNHVNRPPIVQAINDIAVTEGEKVSVAPVAADPDGDKITITFSDPLDQNGEWQTKIGDAGKHRVTVTVSDGQLAVEKQFYIIVQSQNKPPVINSVELSCTGTDVECSGYTVNLKNPGSVAKLKLAVDAEDPDGDQITTTYTGWMTTPTKTVSYGEEGGSHIVTVTVSDGTNTVKKDVTIEVNSAPCLVGITC